VRPISGSYGESSLHASFSVLTVLVNDSRSRGTGVAGTVHVFYLNRCWRCAELLYLANGILLRALIIWDAALTSLFVKRVSVLPRTPHVERLFP